MKILQKFKYKSLIIIKNKKLIGSLNDGDIRRAFIKGAVYNSKIFSFYNRKPIFIYENQLNDTEIKNLILEHKIFILPIVNKKKEVKDIIKYENVIKTKKSTQRKKMQKISCVIMAGGKGKRLLPFSKILPKPLLPMGNKSVIENIMSLFSSNGIDDFLISMNYKAKVLKSYIKELKEFKTKFIEEKEIKGTIGSLTLMKHLLSDHFFVTNCDTLIEYDLSKVLISHKKKNSLMTIILSKKKIDLNYGICEFNKNNELNKLIEKPSKTYFVNTGLYLFSKGIIEHIPKKNSFDVNQLVNKLKKKNKKINTYVINEDSWTDVGTWSPYIDSLEKPLSLI